MNHDMLVITGFACIITFILVALQGYRTYIAPFDSLKASLNFWRLRRCLKACYREKQPEMISVEYRRQFDLNNIELTYGEILLHSFYQNLKILQPKAHEIFYDIGSGSGKLVCSAAILFDIKRAVGIEIQNPLYEFSTKLLRKLKHLQRHNADWQTKLAKVQFHLGDMFALGFHDADIIFINATCFQLENWRQLEEMFIQLKPGTRIMMTTKYLNEPHFKMIHSLQYEMSWGYARVSIFKRTTFANNQFNDVIVPTTQLSQQPQAVTQAPTTA